MAGMYMRHIVTYTVGHKKLHTKLMAIILSHLNRFSEFCHWNILQYICSNVIVKETTLPPTHRYTI